MSIRASFALASLLAMILVSCGGAAKSARAPATMGAEAPRGPETARAEIDRLWRDIETIRRGEDAPSTPSDTSADADVQSEDAVRPMLQPAPAQAGRSARLTGNAELICPDGNAPATAVCTDSCTIAQSICNNAESICRLAGELAGDDWARSKCSDAKVACSEATEACCSCSQRK